MSVPLFVGLQFPQHLAGRHVPRPQPACAATSPTSVLPSGTAASCIVRVYQAMSLPGGPAFSIAVSFPVATSHTPTGCGPRKPTNSVLPSFENDEVVDLRPAGVASVPASR